MSEESKKDLKEQQEQSAEMPEVEATAEAAEETTVEAEAPTAEETLQKQLDETKQQLEKAQKEYMFLLAEFDNFRKRTLKEKQDLIKNASEGAMKDLLPVIDDFERAIQASEKSDDVDSIKEGVNLIYNKFVKYLEKNGVKAIDSTDADFDTEYHEAVTTFPTDDESKKGKVIDTVAKGYTMNDKVIRHSKVVVGQ